MSLPSKPWESAPTSGEAAAPAPGAAPPLPSFTDDVTAHGSMGYGGYQGSPFMSRYGGMSYPGVYGGYGGSPYGGYGTYGAYSPYNSMMGGFGTPGAPNGESEIARLADESTRSAFQSVEHLVHAFSSVSMMLESTYFALYSSFRAVIGVADHLSSVSAQLSQLIGSLAPIRTLRWIIRRTLQVLGMAETDPAETAWNSASKALDVDIRANSTNSSWPVLAFFSVVMGAPYLLYKMFGLSSEENSKWASGEKPHYKAVALYDFIGQNDKQLSFRAGTNIRLAPKHLQSKVQGWLVASVDGERTGLVPYNYLKILGPSEPRKTQSELQQSTASTTLSSCANPKVLTPESETEESDGGSPTNAHNDFVNVSMSEVGK